MRCSILTNPNNSKMPPSFCKYLGKLLEKTQYGKNLMSNQLNEPKIIENEVDLENAYFFIFTLKMIFTFKIFLEFLFKAIILH